MGRVEERLLVMILCMGLVLSGKCVRTHERFSQTTYYADPNRVGPTEMLDKNQFTGPVREATTSTIPGMESKEESRKDFIPTEVTQSGEISPEQKETYTSGDFTADAKPWWVNPEYQNYGHSPLGKPSVDRYPSTFDPRFSNNYQHTRTNFNQYVQDDNQVDYFPQSSKTNAGDYVPYELSSGGCSTEFWSSNTNRWPGFFNAKSTLGDAFGTAAVQVYGKVTIMQALLDTHDDGYHSLARTGCTALLNSYTRQQYKFSHQEVMESFNAALTSNKVAARQAAAFDEANLSTLKEKYNSCV